MYKNNINEEGYLKVKIINNTPWDEPEYKTPLSSGCDLRANIPTGILLAPNKRVTIPTGISVRIPAGFEGQVRGRSGLNFNHDITCHTGTIDADYTGEIKVRLSNDSDDIFEIHPGDRIAQLVFAPVVQAIFEPVESIEPTVRGSRGFGSTGLK